MNNFYMIKDEHTKTRTFETLLNDKLFIVRVNTSSNIFHKPFIELIPGPGTDLKEYSVNLFLQVFGIEYKSINEIQKFLVSFEFYIQKIRRKEVKKIIKNIEDYNKNMSPENKLKLEILKMES